MFSDSHAGIHVPVGSGLLHVRLHESRFFGLHGGEGFLASVFLHRAAGKFHLGGRTVGGLPCGRRVMDVGKM